MLSSLESSSMENILLVRISDYFHRYVHTLSLSLSLYHCYLTFMAIILAFSPMHLLGFNVMPRRIPSFADSVHSPTDQKGGFCDGG